MRATGARRSVGPAPRTPRPNPLGVHLGSTEVHGSYPVRNSATGNTPMTCPDRGSGHAIGVPVESRALWSAEVRPAARKVAP
jgi:hypothetical protein